MHSRIQHFPASFTCFLQPNFLKAPPVSKAVPPTPQESTVVPNPIDDTPTEPATSPRNVDTQVREWPVELQVPTREIGPRPEPEVYPIRHLMNDGQWTPEEHAAHLHKAVQAGNFYARNREAREEAERQNREFVRTMNEWTAQVERAGFKAHPAVPHGSPPKGTSFTCVKWQHGYSMEPIGSVY